MARPVVQPFKGMVFRHVEKGKMVVTRITEKEVYYGYIGDPSTYWYCPKDDFPKYCKEVWHRDQA